MVDCNPLLSNSELTHRFAVDRLKWELGHPVPGWLPPPPPLYTPRYYYNYCYYGGYPYGYPWAAGVVASNEYQYSQGFRDGLKSASGSPGGSRSNSRCAASPDASAPQAANNRTAAVAVPSGKACKDSPAGDLMGLPCASYRRPLCAFPVSSDTSYDNLTRAWPFGCRPFYFRPADPPSVRYCL